MFMAAIPIANIIAAPLAGLLLKADWLGLAGWRWLFILEGIPAIVCGFITIFYLTDWPRDARWLPEPERDWLTHQLETEKKSKRARNPISVWRALHNRDVVLLTLIYFLVVTSNYGLTLWLPKILQRLTGLSSVQVSLITTIPFLAALPAMLLVGWHSDRTGERRLHTALPIFIAGLALAASQGISESTVFSIVMFSVATMGLYGYTPGFWSLPTTFLGETAAAACIGLINSLGSVGGFFGPYVVGYLSTKTGTYQAGVFYLVASAMLSSFLVILIRDTRQPTLKI
jgi:ACS family tartrate transporter-like MFS transporter